MDVNVRADCNILYFFNCTLIPVGTLGPCVVWNVATGGSAVSGI